jgi:DNA polymerase
MDFRLNYLRGVQIDVPLIRRAQEVVRVAIADLCKELVDITGDRLGNATQVDKLRGWLAEHGCPLPNVQKETLEAVLLQEDLTPEVRRVIEIRQSIGKTSTSKIPAFLRRTDELQRMHGMLLFNGAGPGRWTGSGAQLHNLPRPEEKARDVAYIVRVLRNAQMTPREKVDLLNAVFGATMPCIAEAIRGFIIAKPGHRLFVRDFANIEGRCIARIAGEEWKIQAFRAFDEGRGPDLYRVAAAGIFGCSPEDIDDHLRSVGKVSELALGFAGGAPALSKMARKYRIKLVDYQGVIRSSVSNRIIGKAEWGWDNFGFRAGLPQDAWMAAEMVKLAWRERHPAIVALWDKLLEAAMAAIREPGALFAYRSVAYQYGNIKGHNYLLCKLPSGRLLYYPHASIEYHATHWNDSEAYVRFMTTDPVTHRWNAAL